jgi:hypothetical protein
MTQKREYGAAAWDFDWGEGPRELRGWPHHSQCTPAPHQRGSGWTNGAPPVSRRRAKAVDESKVVSPKTPDDVVALWAEEYRAGVSVLEIARRHNYPPSTVRGCLCRIGALRHWAEHLAETWAAMAAEGRSATAIGAAYGVQAAIVAAALTRLEGAAR